MKRFFILLSSVVLIASCKKDETTPVDDKPMVYIDLKDSAVTFNHSTYFDLDGDGQKDILFNTLLVGDAANKLDKKQWYVTSSFTTSLPVNTSEAIPVLNMADSIPVANFNGYNWYNASAIILAQKVIGETGDPYWQGDWKNATHRFIPVQVQKANGVYNAWVEVSFSTANEKIILHKAAISKKAGKAIAAGK